jgi:uncharacterized protein YeaO (DUF488 family)
MTDPEIFLSLVDQLLSLVELEKQLGEDLSLQNPHVQLLVKTRKQIEERKLIQRKSCREVREDPQPDEYYVLVSREYPMEFRKHGLGLKKLRENGIIHDWDRDLAPSRPLLKEFKKNGDWDGYKTTYKKEVPIIVLLTRLVIHSKKANGKQVVLVCIEDDGKYPHCHTWLIQDMLAGF